MAKKILVAVFSASGVGRSDTELHKNASGSAKWVKGVQINRPDEKELGKWLKTVLL